MHGRKEFEEFQCKKGPSTWPFFLFARLNEEGIVFDLFLLLLLLLLLLLILILILWTNLVARVTQEPLGVGPSYLYPR